MVEIPIWSFVLLIIPGAVMLIFSITSLFMCLVNYIEEKKIRKEEK